jgi:hypothetical protein
MRDHSLLFDRVSDEGSGVEDRKKWGVILAQALSRQAAERRGYVAWGVSPGRVTTLRKALKGLGSRLP